MPTFHINRAYHGSTPENNPLNMPMETHYRERVFQRDFEMRFTIEQQAHSHRNSCRDTIQFIRDKGNNWENVRDAFYDVYWIRYKALQANVAAVYAENRKKVIVPHRGKIS